jgi:hypothetical protein
MTPDLDAMGRGVVLHLLGGLEVAFSDRQFAFLPHSLAPAKGRQRRVGELRSCCHELFMHAHQIAFTTLVKLQDLLSVGRGLFGAL